MDRHAFMIMAHGEQRFLERLLQSLDDERNDIYLHIDAKNQMMDTDILRSRVERANLFIYSEIKCYWGDVSLVECELFLLEKATAASHQYYHLISGVDFPLKSMDEIYDFFDKNYGKEFVFFASDKMDERHRDWYLKYYCLQKLYRKSNIKAINSIFYFIEKVSVKLQSLINIKRAKYFKEYYKGSQWFSITEQFAKYVLEFKDIIIKDFHFTFASDEMLLPTLIMNSDFKDNLYIKRFDNSMEQNLRYIIFNNGIPKILGQEDYDDMISSDCIFGRKFSCDNIDLIEKLSENILHKSE